MKNFIFSCILLTFAINLSAQVDTAFWFAAPEANVTHGDRPILLRITSASTLTATVTVSQPANAAFNPISFTLNPNQSQSIDLTPYIDQLENSTPNTVLNYGLKISSSQPITVYYEINHNANPEIFALKGKNALGTTFYTPFQNFVPNGVPNYYSSFDMVAIEDNTVITITPSVEVFGHPANQPFTITLNKGQTYSVRSTGGNASEHPAGSKITSDKPIAVTIKDDTVSGAPWGGCADMCGDQIIPTSLIGKEYIARKGFLNGSDKVFVLATRNNTQIFIDGNNTPIATINESMTYMLDLSNPTIYIRTSEPVYVSHLSGFGCELGMPVLPPVRCTGSNLVSFTRSTNDFFGISIITESGFQNFFELNGNTSTINPASFSPVAGTNGQFVVAQIDMSNVLSVGTANIIKNRQGKFHVGIISGAAAVGAKFGYFSDYNNFSVDINANNPICEGETLRLTIDSIPSTTYSWAGPNGLNSSQANIIIPNVSSNHVGRYILTANYNNCSTKSDTIDVVLKQKFLKTIDTSFCEGGNVVVNGIPYLEVGTFEQRYVSYNGCDSNYRINVFRAQLVVLDSNITICQGQSYTRPNGLIVNTQGLYLDTLRPLNRCPSIQRTNLIVRPAPRIFLGNDTTLCTGTNHILNLSNWNANILWSNGSTNPTFNAQHAGSISVIVTHLDGCVSTDTIQINESAYPIVKLGNDTAVCNGQSVQLRAQNAGCRYLWSTGATGQTIQATQTGNYSVTVTNIFGCSKSDTIQITVAPLMTSAMTTLSEITCNNLCNGKAKIIYNNAYPPVQIAWSNGNRIATADNLCTGRYTATITDSLGCTTQNQVNIANPAAIQALTFVTSNYNGVPISCKGKTDGTAKVVSSGGTGAHTTEWLTQPPQTTIVATGLGAGTTRVVITDINGCKDTASIQLTEPDSITVHIAPIHPICEGNSDGKITFSTIRGGIAPYALSINAQMVPSITSGYNVSGLKVGVYQMRVNDVNNCSSTTYEKSVLAVPKLQLLVSNDTVINLGDSTTIWVQVTNRQNALITYKWLAANTLSCDTCAKTFAKPIHPTDYHVICKDDNGCASEKIMRVKVNAENVVFIPNAFSPNGDDTNDKLTVFGSKAIKQVVEFKIFNRWGNLIYSDENFQPNDKNHGWDGRFNGKELSLGVFVWYATVELIDGSTRTISGDTTILK